MFTNDIIGSSLGGNGVRDRKSIRVFSEGVQSNETPEEAVARRGVGGEKRFNVTSAFAFYQRRTAARYVPDFSVSMVLQAGSVYLRGGDHIPFLERGYPAVRFTEANENYYHSASKCADRKVEFNTATCLKFVDFGYMRTSCKG